MIKIKAVIESGKTTLEITGHSMSAPHGQDIVCAAVSAITQTTVLGLNAIAAAYPEYVEMEITQNGVKL